MLDHSLEASDVVVQPRTTPVLTLESEMQVHTRSILVTQAVVSKISERIELSDIGRFGSLVQASLS